MFVELRDAQNAQRMRACAEQFVGIIMIVKVKVETRNVREMDKFPDGCTGADSRPVGK
jgi:hypothetical protein